MDLHHIRKRILEKAEFLLIGEHTFTPRLEMRVHDVSIKVALKRDEIQDLSHQTEIAGYLKDLLLAEFIGNNQYLTRFIQIENRERNLNQF
jgi:hypothetical protein